MDESTLVTSGADILGTVRGALGDILQYRILDKKIDAEIARPFFVNDPLGGQYALGANGQLYVRGASAGILSATTASALTQVLILGAVIIGGVLAFRALRG